MDWQLDWSKTQAGVLTGLILSASKSMLLYPLRRFGTRKGRTDAASAQAEKRLLEALPKMQQRLAADLAALSQCLGTDAQTPPPVLEELGIWFRSASVESLVRQCVGIYMVAGRQDARSRLVGPISLSLRVEAPLAYAVRQDIINTVANLVANAVGDLLDNSRIKPAASRASMQWTSILESCSWQLEAIQRSIDLVAQPGIRVDDFASFPERYRTAIATAYSRLSTPHWDGEPRVPVEKVYVPARFIHADSIHNLVHALRLWPDVDRTHARVVVDPLSDPANRRIVILGDPGAGKTAFASHLVYRLASRKADVVASTARIPFVVTLREYRKLLRERGTGGLTFAEFIADRCAEDYQVRAPAGVIEFMLLAGSAMVVFDGLDEILNITERRQTADRIEIFTRLFPNCPIMVTSRTNGYESTPLNDELFSAHAILPFGDGEVRRYVDAWFDLDENIPPGLRQRQKRSFLGNLTKLDPKLYTNPLSLALLCNLSKARNHQPLPTSRAELFEKCSLMLYHLWDQRRGIIDVDFERDFLPLIAFAASRVIGDPTLETGFTERKLVHLSVDYLVPAKFEETSEAHRYARSLIEHCVGRAWVFSAVGTTDDDDELFNFTHRTFLEYFAALHLARSHPTAAALADALLPWIVRGERTVISQMAFEIKTRHIDAVAEDFCEIILQRSSTEDRAAVDWLCQEASIVPIGHSVLRRIVQRATEQPAADRLAALSHLASARGENRRLIDREVASFVGAALNSALESSSAEVDALRLIVRKFATQREGEDRERWIALSRRFPSPPEPPPDRPWWDD